MDEKNQLIKNLCNNWLNSIKNDTKGYCLGENSKQYSLLNNGIKFNELTFNELISANINLTRILLTPNLTTIINKDHLMLWAWSAEIVLSNEFNLFKGNDDLKKLFEACVWASLSKCEYKEISHHSKEFLNTAHFSLSYLVFPLLEGLCKMFNPNSIEMNGKVLTSFKKHSNGKFSEHPINNICSSLKDLLHLLYDNAEEPLKQLLDEFKSHILKLKNGKDAFTIIYNWRNNSLHGSTNHHTIGGTLLNLAFLICLYKIGENSYSEKREIISTICMENDKRNIKTPWSYYPAS